MVDQARFQNIPVARTQVVDALADEVGDESGARFRSLAELMTALFHHEFHAQLEEMKSLYRPINPDCERVGFDEPTERERGELSEKLARKLSHVLERGNYVALGDADVEHAFKEKSLFPIEVAVDFDAFDDFVVFARGERVRDATLPGLFGLFKKRARVDTFDRVCLYIRFKCEAELPRKARKQFTYEPGKTTLKLFRNIPKADLEMLFPNTRLKMRLRDKLLIGVPAVVGGVPVALKLAPALLALMIVVGIESTGDVNEPALVAGLTGLVGLGAFLFRQWDKFKNRKVLFMKMLSENLYFRNLDNNEGVLTRLVDEAEEEECKEALCAYAFLHKHPGLTADELDTKIQGWFAQRFDLTLDFEVDDALAKLARLGLADDQEGKYRVVALQDALVTLDRRWDELYPFNNDG